MKKKKEKKKFCTEPGWATAQLSLGHARQGAGALGRAGVGAGRWARGRAGAGLGVQTRRQQAWQRALGAHWAHSRRRRGQAWAQAGVQGAGRRLVAGVRTGANVRGRALACAGVRGRARQGKAGRAGARGRQAGGARQARGARPAWAWPGRSLCARAGPGWGFVHSDSVFLARFDSVVSRVTK